MSYKKQNIGPGFIGEFSVLFFKNGHTMRVIGDEDNGNAAAEVHGAVKMEHYVKNEPNQSAEMVAQYRY